MINKKGSRILIVDDEKDICTLLPSLVRKEGLKALIFYWWISRCQAWMGWSC